MASINKRPDSTGRGRRLPYEEEGLYRFEPPRTFSACMADTSGDAMGSRSSDPMKIVMKLHPN